MNFIKNLFTINVSITPKVKRFMMLAGIFYLLFPYILFYGIFTKTIFASIFIVGCALILFFSVKETPLNEFKSSPDIKLWVIITTVIIAIGILTATGLGGIIGKQASDLDRTNAILNDYLTLGIPSAYYKADGSLWGYLTYYNALYVPSIIIGWITNSFFAAEVTMLIYSCIGLIIGLFWLFIATKKATIKILIMFLFFSGMDTIGYMIINGGLFHSQKHLDLWANVTGTQYGHIANYHSMGTAMRYSVQHYIPAFIVCFLLHYMFTELKNYKTAILLTASLCLWSPFIAISIIPFAIAVFVWEKCDFKKFFSVNAILSIIFIGVPMIVYFLAMPADDLSGTSDGIRGIGWLVYNWPILFLFIALEFGLLCWFLYKCDTVKLPEDRLLFFVSVGMLIGGLFFDFGTCHDFSMRFAIIPWMFIFTMIPNAVENGKSPFKGLLITCLIIGAMSCMTEYSAMIVGIKDYGFNAKRAELVTGFTIDGWDLQYQFVGKPDSIFYKYISR